MPRCSKRHSGKDHQPLRCRPSSSLRKKEIACWGPPVPDEPGSRGRAVTCLSSHGLEQGRETRPALPHSDLCPATLSHPVQLRCGELFRGRLWLHRNRGCGEEWLGRGGQLETSRLPNRFLPAREDRRKARIQATFDRLKSSTHWLFWVPTRIHYCTTPSHGEVLRGLGPAEKDVTVD